MLKTNKTETYPSLNNQATKEHSFKLVKTSVHSYCERKLVRAHNIKINMNMHNNTQTFLKEKYSIPIY